MKLIDFGLSNIYENGQLSIEFGSPIYTAPEMIKGKLYKGLSIGIGIILFYILYGHFSNSSTLKN